MSDRGADRTEPRTLRARFSLREGVRLEAFADGSGLIYRRSPEKSVTLNPTGALLCAHADGIHSIATVIDELRQLSPEGRLDPAEIIAFLDTLVDEGFLRWD